MINDQQQLSAGAGEAQPSWRRDLAPIQPNRMLALPDIHIDTPDYEVLPRSVEFTLGAVVRMDHRRW
jgi:hypothetical protein